MENSYEIGVANRYALFLDEDEDPLEVLKLKKQEKETKKKTKRSEKENKKKIENKEEIVQDARKAIEETEITNTLGSWDTNEENNKPETTPRSASERDERRVRFEESREDKTYLREEEFKSEFSENRSPEKEAYDRGHGGGFQRGVRIFRRGGRDFRPGGFNNRGKRELDRQSGSDKTGVKPVEKRFGAGARNWGTYKDDVEEQLNSPGSPERQTDWTEKTETEVNLSPEKVEVKENEDQEDKTVDPNAEPVVLTLDEYYATRCVRQKPTYNIRKAGEGEDLTQWKNMYELKKKSGGEEQDDEEYDMVEYPQRAGRQKYLRDINFHFSDSRRGRRGFGRGRPRDDERERGPTDVEGESFRRSGEMRSPLSSRGYDNRSWREPFPRIQRQAAPKVDDENDFPSLG